jgi:hypothetical protein
MASVYSLTNPAWIEWAEDTSISKIRLFTASWTIPHSPSLSTSSKANLIWNGLDDANSDGLIQPVAAFNYYKHGSSAANRWTGSAWGVKGLLEFISNPINLNEGDTVQGTMLWVPLLNQWIVVLTDQNTGQITYSFTNAAIKPPLQNLEAYAVYEGRGITFDNEKMGDTPFYSMTFLNSLYLPASANWVSNYNSLNPTWHPYVHGLFVDTSFGSSHVTLYTSKRYTISTTAGDHGSITPSGSTSILAGETPEFTITPNSGYDVDQILVDGNPVTQNPYTFDPVTSNHTISATFRESFCSLLTFTNANFKSSAIQYFNSGNIIPTGTYTLDVTGWDSPWNNDQGWYEEGVREPTPYKTAAWNALTNLRVEGITTPLLTIVNGTFARENSTGSATINLSTPSRVGILIIDSVFTDNRGSATFVLRNAGQTCSATAMKQSVNILPFNAIADRNGNVTNDTFVTSINKSSG